MVTASELVAFPSGVGWTADFGEVNSKAPAAGTGISAWDSVAPQPVATETEEKGWAKFTDFQPFCWCVCLFHLPRGHACLHRAF